MDGFFGATRFDRPRNRNVATFVAPSPNTLNRRFTLGIGVSLILIAVGAVLAFAVNATASGFNVHTVGWILLAVGALGVLLSLVFWSSWGGFGGSRRTVVSERPARRRTVVEDEVA